VTPESFHGAETRTPVEHGGRRVPGLHQRTLKDGRVRFEARLRIDGKDSRIVLEATTKTDAVREYEGLRTDRNRGDVHENRLINPTVAELGSEFIEHLRARIDSRDERFRVAPRTVRTYEGVVAIRLVPALGRKRIADVNIVDLRRLVDGFRAKGLAPATSKLGLAVMSRMFVFAVKQGYVDRNPVRDLDRDERPGGKRLTEPRYLSEEEITRLLDTTPLHSRALLACCAYAGLRNGEARGLQWGDVDFDEGRIRVERQLNIEGEIAALKTPASRATVPMLPVLRRELLAHRQRMAETSIALIHSDRFVFVKTTGAFKTRGETYRSWDCARLIRAAGDEAGLNPPDLPPVGVHDLRHSFIALALEHGATLPEAAELARHSSPQTTLKVYAGLTKDGRGKAAQKLLDAGFGV
jgi:integrase